MPLSHKDETLLGYRNCYNFMQINYGDPIYGQDFYEYVFPDNEVSGENNQNFSKPNAIYLYQPNPDSKKLKRRIMLKDQWENDFVEYVCDNSMTLCSGIAYRGLTNKLEHAQQMNALVFDIDGVGMAQLRTIIARTEIDAEQIRSIPVPTFIVLSGSGLHLYYVFDKPIPLFPNIKLQLKSLKNALTFRIWDPGATSTIKNIQYQSINQGFRMVGSINNKYDTEVVAFEFGERVSLEYLNSYVKSENRVDLTKPFSPTQMSREEAAEKFPEWYEKVVLNKDYKPKKWDIAGKVHGDDPYALYHWWLRQVDKVTGGHRYFYMMNLAIYACKCDVPKKKLNEDLNMVFEKLSQIPHTNAYGQPDKLSKQDVVVAKEAFNKEYYCFKLADHIATSGIAIERNRRNGQKQEWHLEDIRAKKKNMKRRGQAFKNPEGRPKGSGTAQEQVLTWRSEHPDGKKIECHRDTQLSRVTIDRWWNTTMDKNNDKAAAPMDWIISDGDNQILIETASADQEAQKKRLNAYAEGLKEFYGKKTE